MFEKFLNAIAGFFSVVLLFVAGTIMTIGGAIAYAIRAILSALGL